ncbi:MAG: transcription elongation factor GreA [Clostridiales Family XIII bacterium]|jgi:transcription elongation factor GreA|nr:transcription elongation factor GreA [Clostridiales Family XIII bacterium]
MAEEILLTREGYAAKLTELDELRTIKRPEIAERLKEAIAYGDISENSEYDSAKNEQAELEDKIVKLESLLKNAKVIEDDGGNHDVVKIGQKVKIRNIKTKAVAEYIIVSSSEADPINGKISNVSPVGAALIDKKAKAKVEVKLPGGNAKYEILSIG